MKKQSYAFSKKALVSDTPVWAKWMFRITFMITTCLVGWLAATKMFDPHTSYEITLFLKLVVDPIIYGLSKMFGVEVKDE